MYLSKCICTFGKQSETTETGIADNIEKWRSSFEWHLHR